MRDNEDSYTTIRFDTDGFSQVKPQIIKSRRDIYDAKEMFNSIDIPKDFEERNMISKTTEYISHVVNSLNKAINQIDTITTLWEQAFKKNDNIIESVPDHDTIIRKRRADDYKFRQFVTNMSQEFQDIKNDTTTRKFYGPAREMTNAQYIEEITEKAKNYNSDTNDLIIVDTNNCLVTMFKRDDETNEWKAYALWNSNQGVREEGYKIGKEAKATYKGPESRSFTGVFRVDGKIDDGKSYKTCFCFGGEDSHSNTNADIDNDQGFEVTSYLNPDTASQELRYMTHGCTNLELNKARYIYENIPQGTTVVVFNQKDSLPGIKAERDDSFYNTSEYEDITAKLYENVVSDLEYGDKPIFEEFTGAITSNDVNSILKNDI